MYYIPSGVMHGIALEALPLSDGTTLGQHYDFVRLTSAREIVNAHHSNKINRTATLYGGLQYSLAPQKMEEESKVYENLIWQGWYVQSMVNLDLRTCAIRKMK